MKFQYPIIVILSLLAASCTSNEQKSHGSIVLGDSAYIVTEKDSANLRDFVADIHLQQSTPVHEDTVANEQQPQTAAPSEDTTQPHVVQGGSPAQPVAAAAPAGSGLNIDFGELKVLIPGIATRSFSRNPVGANGASYQLTGGQLNGNQLKLGGATVSRVTQRYLTSVLVRTKDVNAVLSSLNYTSAWEVMKGGNGSYYISGLDPSQLKYTNATGGQLSTALRNAIHSKRYSRKKEAQILNELNGVRSVTQAPLKVVLHTVIWQIEGKDNAGKAFKKEVRLDMII